MKNIIFVGGCKGVGKSTLIKSLTYKLNFKYIHTGKLRKINKIDFENNYINLLKESQYNIILDTHFVVNSSKDFYTFYQGLSFNSLKKINQINANKIIVNIISKPMIILQRRLIDGLNKRCLDIEQIIKEHNLSTWYSSIYSYMLNSPKITFTNNNLSITDTVNNLKKELIKYI